MEFDDDDDDVFLAALEAVNAGLANGGSNGVRGNSTVGMGGSFGTDGVGGTAAVTGRVNNQTNQTPRLQQTLLAPFKRPMRNPPPDFAKPTKQVTLHAFGMQGGPPAVQAAQSKGSYRAVAETATTFAAGNDGAGLSASFARPSTSGGPGAGHTTFGHTANANFGPGRPNNNSGVTSRVNNTGSGSGSGSGPQYVIPAGLPNPPPNMSPHPHDPTAILSWIYPTNMPVRSYQIDIVRRSLFQNTLVSLPTGLGKTFIAAVVILNHLRWFPKSRVVFIAPTKALVTQQMEACWKSVGIPVEWCGEMTGEVMQGSRILTWTAKRLLFCTAQVLQNDLDERAVPAETFSLLVVDEAHRAQGNHSYCMCIKLLLRRNPHFRVLALTATPGSDTNAVQSVLSNLLISAIEIRADDHPDVAPYVHERKSELVVLKEDATGLACKGALDRIVNPVLSRLMGNKAIWTNKADAISSYGIMTQRDKWRRETKITLPPAQAHAVEADFGAAISLVKAMNNLVQFGIRTARKDLVNYKTSTLSAEGHVSQTRRNIVTSREYSQLLDNIESLVTQPEFFGHPKLRKLAEVVREHFGRARAEGRDTRCMVFSSLRESVEEIVEVLSRQAPVVRVAVFVGQSGGSTSGRGGGTRGRGRGGASGSSGRGKGGMSQKEQSAVLQRFLSGTHNVLVATSIGEEGLDIGEVDLIVCYDSQASPTRMIQRMGRTGRKREGRVVLLLQEGKEERSYHESLQKYRNMQRAIAMQEKRFKFYPPNQLLPPDINGGSGPQLVKQIVEIPSDADDAIEAAAKALAVAGAKSAARSDVSSKAFLTKEELLEFQRMNSLHHGVRKYEWTSAAKLRYLHLQGRPTGTHLLGHSSRCLSFVNLVDRVQGFLEEEAEERGLDIANRKVGSYAARLERFLEMGDVLLGVDSFSWDAKGELDGRATARKRKTSTHLDESDDDDFRTERRAGENEDGYGKGQKRRRLKRPASEECDLRAESGCPPPPTEIEENRPLSPMDPGMEFSPGLDFDWEIAPALDPIKVIEEAGVDPLASLLSPPESAHKRSAVTKANPPVSLRLLEIEDSDDEIEAPSQLLRGSVKTNISNADKGNPRPLESLKFEATRVPVNVSVRTNHAIDGKIAVDKPPSTSVKVGVHEKERTLERNIRAGVDRSHALQQTPPLAISGQVSTVAVEQWKRFIDELPRVRRQGEAIVLPGCEAPAPLLRVARRRKEREEQRRILLQQLEVACRDPLGEEDYLGPPPGRQLWHYLEAQRANIVSTNNPPKSSPAHAKDQPIISARSKDLVSPAPLPVSVMNSAQDCLHRKLVPSSDTRDVLRDSSTSAFCLLSSTTNPQLPLQSSGVHTRKEVLTSPILARGLGQASAKPTPVVLSEDAPSQMPIAKRKRKLGRRSPKQDPLTEDAIDVDAKIGDAEAACEPRRRRLVRLGSANEQQERADADAATASADRVRIRREKLPMHLNPIFDVEAEESDNSQASSDDPDGQDLDQDLDGFIVADDYADSQAIITSELEDGDRSEASGGHISMRDFYRQSLLTPNVARHHGVHSRVHDKFGTLPNQLGGLGGKFRMAWALRTPESSGGDARDDAEDDSQGLENGQYDEDSGDSDHTDETEGEMDSDLLKMDSMRDALSIARPDNEEGGDKEDRDDFEILVPPTPPHIVTARKAPFSVPAVTKNTTADYQSIDRLLEGVDFNDLDDSDLEY
ncbi:hypothetical protein HDU93_000848 [Gonapodya sp. JEL0774]|nr:hypothetical protein HDU93_000848 [Gonapodya sp. JEL0774]